MKPNRPVGIIGYGAYVPHYRLPATEVSRVWEGGKGGGPVKEKAVAGLDEDVITMSIEAARNALARAQVDPAELRAVWVGSESHPYAVKPSSTIVAEAIGAGPSIQAGDWEFACKAGTEAMVAAIAMVGSGMADYAMAIGMDTAQGRPGDPLEYTAASGGAAYILGPAEEALAVIEGSYSYVTDTPDFLRRADQRYPEHGQRFTGEPAYFKHITEAAGALMEDLGTTPADFRYAVFHQPNTKFPQRVAADAGLQRRADQARAALPRDRQHLCRGLVDWPQRGAGRGPARRPHSDGFVWLGRRFGRFRYSRNRGASQNGAGGQLPPTITSPGVPRSIMPPTRVIAGR